MNADAAIPGQDCHDDCGCPPNTLCGSSACPRAIKVTCNEGEWVMRVTTQKESE